MEDETKIKVLKIVEKNPRYLNFLKKIIEYQEKEFRCQKCGSRQFERVKRFTFRCLNCGTENIFIGFHTMEIGLAPAILTKLRYEGILEVLSKSSRGGVYYYLPFEREQQIKQIIQEIEEKKTAKYLAKKKEIEIPEDIFSPIYGYDDLKKILIKALQSLKKKRRVHILLIGPPASAKSMVLEELNRIDGSQLILAGTSTRAGIRDLLADLQPKILLIDELDKVQSATDTSVLLTWMETGKIIITMATRMEEIYNPGIVIASANTTRNIPPELLSRFLRFYLKPYTKKELKGIIVKVLTEREGKDKDLAEYIAEKVVEDLKSTDPRDGVKIGRLCDTKEEVDEIIKTMKKYNKIF